MSLQPYIFIEHQGCYIADIQVGRLNSGFVYQFGLLDWDEQDGDLPLFLPRGLPDKVSQQVRHIYCRIVDDVLATKYPGNIYVTRHQAGEWITAGKSEYLDVDKKYINDPDFYCASWLTASELEQLCNKVQEETGEDNILFRSVIAMMNVLNQGDDTQTRIVFWFS